MKSNKCITNHLKRERTESSEKNSKSRRHHTTEIIKKLPQETIKYLFIWSGKKGLHQMNENLLQ